MPPRSRAAIVGVFGWKPWSAANSRRNANDRPRQKATVESIDDLPYRTQQGIEAMQEVLQTFNTTVFQMTIDSVERTNEDLEKFVRVAEDMRFLVSDVSFTSSYSADPISHFWRNLSSQNKGIIDFVAKLKEAERLVFFGVLVRLQRYLADPAPSKSAMHDLVQDEDRSSVLYYLLGAKEARFEDCVARGKGAVGLERFDEGFAAAGRHDERAVVAGELVGAPGDELRLRGECRFCAMRAPECGQRFETIVSSGRQELRDEAMPSELQLVVGAGTTDDVACAAACGEAVCAGVGKQRHDARKINVAAG